MAEELTFKISGDAAKLLTALKAAGGEFDKFYDKADPSKRAPTRGGFLETFFGVLSADLFQKFFSGIVSGAKDAVSEIVQLGERGAAINDLAAGFDALNARIGNDGPAVLDRLNQAFDKTITKAALMEATNASLSRGLKLSADDFDLVAQSARVVADRVGGDALQTYESFLSAISSGNPKLLKQHAITVDVDRALKGYAASIGKSTEDLTDHERRLAFQNATLAKFRAELEASGPAQRDFGDRIDRITTFIDNMHDSLAQAIDQSPVLAAGLDGLSDALDQVFGKDQKTKVDALTKGIGDFAILVAKVGLVVVEAGRFIVRTWDFVKIVVLGVLTALVAGLELVAKANAALLESMAKMPGIGRWVKENAESARDFANQLSGMRTSLAEQTGEAIDASAKHEKAFDKIGAVIGTVVVAMEHARDTQGKLTKATKDHKPVQDDTNEAVREGAKLYEEFAKKAGELEQKLKLAGKAGLSELAITQRFGDDVLKLGDAARALPGAFAKLPPLLSALYATLEEQRLSQMFNEEWARIQAGWAEMSESIQKGWGVTVGVGTQGFRDLVDGWRDAEDRMTLATKTGLAHRLAEVDQAEKEEIASFEHLRREDEFAYQARLTVVRAYYEDARKLATGYTGDVVRDAEARGFQERAELERTAQVERQVLADMIRSHTFTAEQIAAQRETVRKAEEEAAGKITADWRGALGEIAESFRVLAEIGGEAFQGLAKWMGELVALLNLADKAGKTFGDGLKAVRSGNLAGLANMAAGVMGIVGAFAQATDKASAFKRAVGGAMVGAKAGASIGAMFGPIGAAIGSAIGGAVGLIGGLLRKPGFKDVMNRVGREWGVEISEALAREIDKRAKELFRGDRAAAEIFSLDKILGEAGGLKSGNFEKFTAKLRDVFVLLERGKFSADQAREVLDKNFGAFAKHVLDSGRVASAQFREILVLNQRMGTESKAIAEFIASQAQRAGAATGAIIAPFLKDLQKLKELEKAREGVDDPAKLAEITKAYEAQKAKVGDVNTELARLERLSLAAFNAARANGLSYVEAIEAMGLAVDQLVEAHTLLGTKAGPALAEILKFRQITQQNPELVQSAAAVNELALALSNLGGLNAETLADLEAQGLSTFDTLVAAGFTEGQALEQMKGLLQTVRDAHVQLGLPIDANTQRLLDQATAQGILKDEGMSTNNILMEGLSSIIEALGGKVPEAFRKMKESMRAESAEGAQAVQDHVGQAVDGINVRLTDTKWEEWAARGGVAGELATSGIEEAAAAVGGVASRLANTDWTGWATEFVGAAHEAAGAADAVSLGSSPGGLKEIPIKLADALRAARAFSREFGAQLRGVGGVVDETFRDNQLLRAGSEFAMAQAAAGAAAPSMSASLTEQNTFAFSPTVLDADGLETAMERRLLPMLLKVLRRNNTGTLTQMKDLLGVT